MGNHIEKNQISSIDEDLKAVVKKINEALPHGAYEEISKRMAEKKINISSTMVGYVMKSQRPDKHGIIEEAKAYLEDLLTKKKVKVDNLLDGLDDLITDVNASKTISGLLENP